MTDKSELRKFQDASQDLANDSLKNPQDIVRERVARSPGEREMARRDMSEVFDLPEDCIIDDQSRLRDISSLRQTVMRDYQTIWRHKPMGASQCLRSIQTLYEEGHELWPRSGEPCETWKAFLREVFRKEAEERNTA